MKEKQHNIKEHKLWEKSVNNEIMLITYADCMGNDLNDLENVLNKYLEGAVGGLTFFHFSHHQQTEVFAPTTYKEVDPVFGTWENIERLSKKKLSYVRLYDQSFVDRE